MRSLTTTIFGFIFLSDIFVPSVPVSVPVTFMTMNAAVYNLFKTK